MTQIEKEQFLGNYIGCEIEWLRESDNTWITTFLTASDFSFLVKKKCRLIAKSIESITDEDALEGSDLLRNANHLSEESRIIQFKRLFESPNFWVNQTNIPLSKFFIVIDFLRSKGYLLPFRQYSTEQLIESGIVKI